VCARGSNRVLLGAPSTHPLDARLTYLPKMKTVTLVAGAISTLLGGLWLLQGLGLVHVRPILCFVDCAPVQEPSLTWAIVGLVAAALGTVTFLYSLKHRARRSSNNRWRGP